MTVLILTHPQDVHADAVVKHLGDAGVAVHRTDTTDLRLAVRLGGATLAGRFGGCDLSQVRCVWHRRPSEPDVPDPGGVANRGGGADPGGVAELRAAIGGVLAGLPHLNHPHDMAAAALKPYQLVAAARHGLRVPATVVATDPSPAADLARQHADRVVVKPLARGVGGCVTAGDRTGWARPAHLTQQQIDKTHDVRLTVVAGDLFAIRIDSPHLDWRTDPDQCRYQRVDAPPEVAGPTLALLRSLRLRFAALDFAVDRAGTWWFLEVNPNGQWLWLEHATGAPIARAVAHALAHPEEGAPVHALA